MFIHCPYQLGSHVFFFWIISGGIFSSGILTHFHLVKWGHRRRRSLCTVVNKSTINICILRIDSLIISSFCTCMLFNHNVIYTYTIYVLMYSEYQGKCLETGTFRYKLINKYSHLPMYLSVVTFCIVYYIYTYIFINTYSIYTSMMSQRRWLNMVGGQGDQIRRAFWYRFDHVRPYLIGSSS